MGLIVVGLVVGFPEVGFFVGVAVVGLFVVGLVVGLALVGLRVGLEVVGFTVVGFNVVGFLVVGLIVVGFNVVGFEVGVDNEPASFLAMLLRSATASSHALCMLTPNLARHNKEGERQVYGLRPLEKQPGKLCLLLATDPQTSRIMDWVWLTAACCWTAPFDKQLPQASRFIPQETFAVGRQPATGTVRQRQHGGTPSCTSRELKFFC